jgi:hypothetical protein
VVGLLVRLNSCVGEVVKTVAIVAPTIVVGSVCAIVAFTIVVELVGVIVTGLFVDVFPFVVLSRLWWWWLCWRSHPCPPAADASLIAVA